VRSALLRRRRYVAFSASKLALNHDCKAASELPWVGLPCRFGAGALGSRASMVTDRRAPAVQLEVTSLSSTGRERWVVTKGLTRLVCAAGALVVVGPVCGGGGGQSLDGSLHTGGSMGGSGAADGSGTGGQWPPSCNYAIPCPRCGDGQMDPGEACDDGNTAFGDGCNGLCQAEFNWDCLAGYCTPVSSCGDARVTYGEACDDGNTASGDGCAADCLAIEKGWYCPAPGQRCKPVGDTMLAFDAGVGCEDAGSCQPTCGNGVLEPGEECDDGAAPNVAFHNDDDRYGGCETHCRLGPHCGDGLVNGAEECDTGELNGQLVGDGACTLACAKPHVCGDGFADGDLGEACDLGALNGQPDQACDQACKNVAVPKPCLLCL
jgi:cysteine-rich repeat protein